MAILDPVWLMRVLSRLSYYNGPGPVGWLAVRVVLINDATPLQSENSWNIRRLTLTDY